jgi:hypothetical protein
MAGTEGPPGKAMITGSGSGHSGILRRPDQQRQHLSPPAMDLTTHRQCRWGWAQNLKDDPPRSSAPICFLLPKQGDSPVSWCTVSLPKWTLPAFTAIVVEGDSTRGGY